MKQRTPAATEVLLPPNPVVKYTSREILNQLTEAIGELGKFFVRDRPFAFSAATIDTSIASFSSISSSELHSDDIPKRFWPSEQVTVLPAKRLLAIIAGNTADEPPHIAMNILLHLTHLRSGLQWHVHLWEAGKLKSSAVWLFCLRSTHGLKSPAKSSPSSHIPQLAQWLPRLQIKNKSLWKKVPLSYVSTASSRRMQPSLDACPSRKRDIAPSNTTRVPVLEVKGACVSDHVVRLKEFKVEDFLTEEEPRPRRSRSPIKRNPEE